MKTQAQIDELKAQWLADPCWDIADTEGFEAHQFELEVFQVEQEAKWSRLGVEAIRDKAAALKCSLELAEYIQRLEDRLEVLEGK